MSRLLRDETEDDPVVRFGAKALLVRDEFWDNSAAKFWSGLLDEIVADYPECDSLSLSAPSSDALNSDVLYPVDVLQREIDGMEQVDLAEAIRRATEDAELFGMPAKVTIALFSGTVVLKTRVLPGECVDANTFAYLCGWLLSWSRIPEHKWNEKLVSGTVSALDHERNIRYRMKLAFSNIHLSEGLFSRTVLVRFTRVNPRREGRSGRAAGYFGEEKTTAP